MTLLGEATGGLSFPAQILPGGFPNTLFSLLQPWVNKVKDCQASCQVINMVDSNPTVWKIKIGARVIAQGLRALAALADNTTWVPSTQVRPSTTLSTPLSGNTIYSSYSKAGTVCIWCTHRQSRQTHIHINKNKIKPTYTQNRVTRQK